MRIQTMLKALLLLIRPVLQPVYLALDGHFGNYPAFLMVQQCGLQLISKLRFDAALCFPFSGEYKGSGPHSKYGERVDYQHIPDTYLKSTTLEFNFRDPIQFWGLEDFMNVDKTTVTNAANLSLFMVNVAQLLTSDETVLHSEG